MKKRKQNQSHPALSLSDKRKMGALIGVIVLSTALLIFYITRNTGPKIVEVSEDQESMDYQISENSEEEEESGERSDSEEAFADSHSSEEKSEESFEKSSQELPPEEKKPVKTGTSPKKDKKTYKPQILKELPAVETEISVRPMEESTDRSESNQNPGRPSQAEPNKNGNKTDKKGQNSLMAFGQQILNASAYDRQKIGNAPVYFYQHPNQPMGIDLRSDPGEASNLYVLPTEKGFVVMNRHLMALMNWTEDDITRNLFEGKVIPGLVEVRQVSETEAQALKEDSSLETLLENRGMGQYLVFFRARENAWMMDSLLSQLGEKPIDLSFVQNTLSPDGLIGMIDPPKGKNPMEEFSDLKKNLESDPGRVEWRYQLPLYGPGNYKVGARDLRAQIPETHPSYSCGVADLNGDGNPEFLIHARLDQEKKTGLQGYYAILTPSPTGLITTEVISHGNGPLIKNGKALLTASQSEKEGVKILQISENQYPPGGHGWVPAEVHFLQPKGLGKSLSGKDLARLYPDHYLVPHEGKLYLVPLADYDMLMDFALNKLTGGSEVFLKDANDPQSFPAQRIKDPADYLAKKFPDLPFRQEDWSKAQPAGMFRADPMPITYEDLAMGAGGGKGPDQRTEKGAPSPITPLPDDPMNPVMK